MSADLPAIRARLAAATPGERTIRPCLSWWRVFAGEDCIAEPNELADATLIAHAPADLAALLDEVEALRAEVSRIRRAHDCIYWTWKESATEVERLRAEVERLRGVVSSKPRVCQDCRTTGNFHGALTHCACGGRLG